MTSRDTHSASKPGTLDVSRDVANKTVVNTASPADVHVTDDRTKALDSVNNQLSQANARHQSFSTESRALFDNVNQLIQAVRAQGQQSPDVTNAISRVEGQVKSINDQYLASTRVERNAAADRQALEQSRSNQPVKAGEIDPVDGRTSPKL